MRSDVVIMNKILLYLIEFMKIGLLAFGGGLATIPFLKEFGANYNLFDIRFLVEMIAISESTPGPIGINMASYIGFNTHGIIGAILFSIALVLPSVVVVLFIAKFIKNLDKNIRIQKIMSYLRPVTVALITGVFLPILQFSYLKDNLHYLSILITLSLVVIYKKTNLHPIFLICLGTICGILFQL